eukprot:gene10666-1939_t
MSTLTADLGGPLLELLSRVKGEQTQEDLELLTHGTCTLRAAAVRCLGVHHRASRRLVNVRQMAKLYDLMASDAAAELDAEKLLEELKSNARKNSTRELAGRAAPASLPVPLSQATSLPAPGTPIPAPGPHAARFPLTLIVAPVPVRLHASPSTVVPPAPLVPLLTKEARAREEGSRCGPAPAGRTTAPVGGASFPAFGAKVGAAKTGVRYCTKCGQQCTLAQKFCGGCGAKLSEDDAPPDPATAGGDEMSKLMELVAQLDGANKDAVLKVLGFNPEDKPGAPPLPGAEEDDSDDAPPPPPAPADDDDDAPGPPRGPPPSWDDDDEPPPPPPPPPAGGAPDVPRQQTYLGDDSDDDVPPPPPPPPREYDSVPTQEEDQAYREWQESERKDEEAVAVDPDELARLEQ